MQDALLTLWRAAQRGAFHRSSHGETSRWLRTTLLRQVMAEQRRNNVSLLDPELCESIWQAWEPADNAGPAMLALEQCLQILDERERCALRLQYSEERGLAEIGECLELKASGARTLLKRIRSKLRDCIQGKLWERDE